MMKHKDGKINVDIGKNTSGTNVNVSKIANWNQEVRFKDELIRGILEFKIINQDEMIQIEVQDDIF